MEITRTLERLVWHIEPKPDGGFIARCNDKTVPPIEGATRLEVEQKIREKIAGELSTQFPGLNLSLDKPETKILPLDTKFDLAFTKPGDSPAQADESGVKNKIEQWLTANAVAMVESKLPPEVMEKLKTQAHDGKLKFTVTMMTLGSGENEVRTKVISLGEEKAPLQLDSQNQKASGALQPSAPVSASFSNSQLDTASPITPVSGNTWFLKFLMAALVVLGLLFFVAHLKK
jgi:hypothetical protein